MALSFARKAAIAAVAVAAFGGISFGASAIAATSGPAAHSASAPVSVVAKRSASAHQQVPQVITQVIGKGRMDGHRWSVVLEFHRTLPKGDTLPTFPNGTAAPGTSLLCQRMFIGGVRIDHQGGPWADCQPVTGTRDPQASEDVLSRYVRFGCGLELATARKVTRSLRQLLQCPEAKGPGARRSEGLTHRRGTERAVG